jgi:hypothetical protein
VTDGIVEVGSFPNEPSAWLARAVLEAAGIPSQVITDPPYVLALPLVRLAVRVEDAEAAIKALRASSGNPSA